jgi:hypothetical protein
MNHRYCAAGTGWSHLFAKDPRVSGRDWRVIHTARIHGDLIPVGERLGGSWSGRNFRRRGESRLVGGVELRAEVILNAADRSFRKTGKTECDRNTAQQCEQFGLSWNFHGRSGVVRRGFFAVSLADIFLDNRKSGLAASLLG